MQFRERSQVIQLIRTVYDPKIRRGRSELVGRIDKQTPRIDDTLRSVCTSDELREIETFLKARSALLSRGATHQSAMGLAGQMRLVESYFRSPDDPHQAQLAAEIFAAWDDLKKAMHKGGFRKKSPPHQGRKQ